VVLSLEERGEKEEDLEKEDALFVAWSIEKQENVQQGVTIFLVCNLSSISPILNVCGDCP